MLCSLNVFRVDFLDDYEIIHYAKFSIVETITGLPGYRRSTIDFDFSIQVVNSL